MKYNKIFCIGFSKTGTSSLHQAFRHLGLKSCHHRHRGMTGVSLIEKSLRLDQPLLQYMPDYDAYSDMTLYRYYKILDTQYPGSAFIFTYRNLLAWTSSKIKHDKRWNMANPDKPARDISDQRIKELAGIHQQFEKEINEYFSSKKNFLSIDVTTSNNWSPICSFLELPVPRQPFPHCNQANPNFKEANIRRFKSRITRILYKPLNDF